MEETPSTACCVSGFPVIHQQRVLLFGSVRCDDLDSSSGSYFQTSEQSFRRFRHGRAQMLQEHQRQQLYVLSQKRLQKLNQRNGYQEKDSLNDLNNYFTSLGGGTSSQTSDGHDFGKHSFGKHSFGNRDFGKHQALFGEGLYDETI